MTSIHGGNNITLPLPIITALTEYAAKGIAAFHTPGHKGGKGLYNRMHELSLASIDLTELPGLDDLHQPSGIIAYSQAICASVYGAKESFYLVNGGSTGIHAAFLSTLRPGEEVLIPRNAHKSVYAALIFTGAKPVYYLPEIQAEFGLALGQDPLNIILEAEQHPQIKVCAAICPTYYGTTWDLGNFRAKWDGIIIADEAHGAHFNFSNNLPVSALELGADITVQSTHKTLGALTQGAVLHLAGQTRVTADSVRRSLDLLQTTSPSYIIMASLEGAVCDAAAQGRVHWNYLLERMLEIKDKLINRGVRVLGAGDVGSYGIHGIDQSRLLLNFPGQAAAIAKNLANCWGVQPELWDRDNILFITGIGDDLHSLDILEKALLGLDLPEYNYYRRNTPFWTKLPKQMMTPREANFSELGCVKLAEGVGRISGCTLAPYPPGIPLIVPGEVFSQELIEFIGQSLNVGVHWQGISGNDCNITIVEE